MKKKNSREVNVFKSQQQTNDGCKICSFSSVKQKINPIFQLNYELISRTINQTMQKPTFLLTTNKILQRQPSRQSITYQQAQKNLVFQQYLKQYYTIHKTNQKIQNLIMKHLPNVKANYMDFKIKNFLILNKYRVVNQRPNLPYPLCMQFQKQTDSKMSSTKSVQNKVLQQLDQDIHSKRPKKINTVRQSNQRVKKYNKNNRKSNQKFQLHALTKGISQMIQNIKDARALEKFKKEMQKSTQFKYGISKNNDFQGKDKKTKKHDTKNNIESKKILMHLNQIKEKQFKRKVENDMLRHFPDDKSKNNSQSTKMLHPNREYHLPVKKSGSKSKLSFRSQQRLQTNPDNYQFEQYGLSVIRQRKKSKSKKKKSKSRQHSHRSKQSTEQHFKMPKSKRLETQYVDSSTLRLHTGQSMLMKSKSSSRIPTQYDSGIIIKPRKSKSKSKYDHFLFSNAVKKQSKSNSISSNGTVGVRDFKKNSKHKSKMKLMEFTSPSKLLLRK